MTAVTPADVLTDGVREIVRAVRVAPDRISATVGERAVTAQTPRELRQRLSEVLYEEFHSGQGVGRVPTRLRDPALDARFASVVPHQTMVVRAVVRSAAERTGDGLVRLLVEREGVRFWAPAAALGTTDGRPGDAVELTIPSARPGLSPGFFLVDGSRPRRVGRRTLRVYVHVVSADHAVDVWAVVLRLLQDRDVPYRAKVLSAPELYPRRDAVVVYLDAELAALAAELADAVRDLPGIGPDVSSFGERICAGVATAWEPVDPHPGRQGLSFGQHRASVLAAALVEAAGDAAPAELVVAERFTEAAIDPASPARNLA